ncbi:MAG TPA: hypothetical protein VK681_39310 [Reyranella sp.]|nr:hypothetical protein [Reyranella sp.]
MPYRSFDAQLTAASNPICNKPPGTSIDDILTAVLPCDNGGAGTVTGPAGWSHVTGSPLNSGSDGQTLFVMQKKAGGAEPSTYQFTNNQGDPMRLWILAHSGEDPAAFLHRVSALVSSTTFNSTWNMLSAAFGSVTTAICDLIFIGSNDTATGGTLTHTPPGGFTEKVDDSDAGKLDVEIAIQDSVGAGATGSLTGTGSQTPSVTTAPMVIVIALAQAVAGASAPPPDAQRATLLCM